jgi:hypothetical protein
LKSFMQSGKLSDVFEKNQIKNSFIWFSLFSFYLFL